MDFGYDGYDRVNLYGIDAVRNLQGMAEFAALEEQPIDGAMASPIPIQQPASIGLGNLFETITNFVKSPIGLLLAAGAGIFFAYRKGYITKQDVFGDE